MFRIFGGEIDVVAELGEVAGVGACRTCIDVLQQMGAGRRAVAHPQFGAVHAVIRLEQHAIAEGGHRQRIRSAAARHDVGHHAGTVLRAITHPQFPAMDAVIGGEENPPAGAHRPDDAGVGGAGGNVAQQESVGAVASPQLTAMLRVAGHEHGGCLGRYIAAEQKILRGQHVAGDAHQLDAVGRPEGQHQPVGILMRSGQQLLEAANAVPTAQVQHVAAASGPEITDAVPTVAGAEDEAVAAGTAFHIVVAAIAGDGVVTRAAEQQVTRGTARDLPPGDVGKQHIIGGQHTGGHAHQLDRISRAELKDEAIAVLVGRGKEFGKSAGHLPVAEVQHVAAASGPEITDAVPTIAGTEDEAVAARSALHVVVATVAGDCVVTCPAEQQVAAASSRQGPSGR